MDHWALLFHAINGTDALAEPAKHLGCAKRASTGMLAGLRRSCATGGMPALDRQRALSATIAYRRTAQSGMAGKAGCDLQKATAHFFAKVPPCAPADFLQSAPAGCTIKNTPAPPAFARAH
jgi:hypothetical protein